MEKFLSEHKLAVMIATKIAKIVASYFFIGMGWWLILDILVVNTETLRLGDWIMIAFITRVLILNTVNTGIVKYNE